MKKTISGLLYPTLTIVLTVLSFIFYSMYVVNGQSLQEMMQGTAMLGRQVPIWVVFVVESCLALTLELLFGHPYSQKKVEAHAKGQNAFFTRLVSVSSTVIVMCPVMSFIANILYSPLTLLTSPAEMLASWLRLVCYNLPFVFFLQLLVIQPFLQWAFARVGEMISARHERQSALLDQQS